MVKWQNYTHALYQTRSISNWSGACWTHPFIPHCGTIETAGSQPRPRAPSLRHPCMVTTLPYPWGATMCVHCILILTSLAPTSQSRIASKVINWDQKTGSWALGSAQVLGTWELDIAFPPSFVSSSSALLNMYSSWAIGKACGVRKVGRKSEMKDAGSQVSEDWHCYQQWVKPSGPQLPHLANSDSYLPLTATCDG